MIGAFRFFHITYYLSVIPLPSQILKSWRAIHTIEQYTLTKCLQFCSIPGRHRRWLEVSSSNQINRGGAQNPTAPYKRPELHRCIARVIFTGRLPELLDQRETFVGWGIFSSVTLPGIKSTLRPCADRILHLFSSYPAIHTQPQQT